MENDELQVFGIPYPLTLETILNALVLTQRLITQYVEYMSRDPHSSQWQDTVYYQGLRRKHTAFRERILRVDAEKEAAIERLRRNNQTFADAAVEGTDKDARIAEMEERREIIDVDKSHLWNINKNLKQRIAELEDMLDTANHDTGRVQ